MCRCVRRANFSYVAVASAAIPLPHKRKSRKRQFYGEYVSPTEVDVAIEDSLYDRYAYFMPQHMGGKRRSERIAQQLKEYISMAEDLLYSLPLPKFEEFKTLVSRPYDPGRQLQLQPAPAQQPENIQPVNTRPTNTQPAPTQPANAQPAPAQPDSPITEYTIPAKKRRFVQFVYEMMGCPPELFPDGTDCWDGKFGVINKIKNFLGLHNSRSRQQIRSVLKYIQDCLDQGILNFDAGKKRNAHKSGRKRKLTDSESRLVAKCLRQDFGLEMSTAIINHKLGDGNEVSLSTVRHSAKTVFGGKCHNRATKKTGNRDVNSPWCQGRFAFGLQLQQQFRDDDTPGPSMIGVKVVRLFDGVPFVGTIIEFDTAEKFYKVYYKSEDAPNDEASDMEELEFDELRVSEWKKLDRRQVLWLDEKHKKVCALTPSSPSLTIFTLTHPHHHYRLSLDPTIATSGYFL